MDTIKKCDSCKCKGEPQSGEANLLTVDELMHIKHGTVVWEEIKGKADLIPMIASDHRTLIGEYEEIRITRQILEPVPLFFGGPMRRRFWAGGIPKEEKRTGAKW